jgi:hypothetical protein
MLVTGLRRSALMRRIAAADVKRRIPFRRKAWEACGAAPISGRNEHSAQHDRNWVFICLVPQDPSKVEDASWLRSPIHAVILNRIEGEGLRPYGIDSWRGPSLYGWMP